MFLYSIGADSSYLGQKKIFSELSKIVWTVFKTMLFAFTAILKAVAVDIPSGEGLVNVKHAGRFSFE